MTVLRVRIHGLALGALLACGTVVFATVGTAQEPLDLPACTSFEIPPDHWSTEALRRAEALGEVWLQAPKRTVPVCRVATAFEELAGRGGERTLFDDWRERFEEEFADVPGSAPHLRFASGELLLSSWEGRGAPGRGEFPPERTGVIAVPDETTPVAIVGAGVTVLPGLDAVGRARAHTEGLNLDRLEIVAGTGPVSITLGRGWSGYGYARSGAVAASGPAPVDRLEVTIAPARRLPGPFRIIGPVTVTSFLGRLDDARHSGDPYLWGASGSFRPHSRLTVAVNRAAMFGGRGYEITAVDLLNLAVGRVVGGGFEDQVVSLELVLRIPSEEIVPLTAYMEWGAEDAAGAWRDVPGRILGLYAPAVPGLPELSLAVEYTDFAISCCFNPEWYRHWAFPGSWVVGDEVLGHPLGGHGSQLSLQADLQLPREGLFIDVHGFRRNRRAENLFVPGREGRSWGATTRLTWRMTPRIEGFASTSTERGSDWTELQLELGARILLTRK